LEKDRAQIRRHSDFRTLGKDLQNLAPAFSLEKSAVTRCGALKL